MHTLPARDDLVARLEEQFDREVLEEASARIRLRVEPSSWEAFQLTAVEGLTAAEAAARLGKEVAAAVQGAAPGAEDVGGRGSQTRRRRHMTAHCPPEEQLEQLLDDRLEATEDAALARHVESCAECQDRLEQLLRKEEEEGEG